MLHFSKYCLAEVTITTAHNHITDNAAALAKNAVSPAIRATLTDMFLNGMRPAEAVKCMKKDTDARNLADRSKVPDYKYAHR